MTTSLHWRGLTSNLPTRRLVGGLVVLGALLALPSVLPSPVPPVADPAVVGTEDFSFRAAGVKAPSGPKPEASKLWFNDGSWWGVLFRPYRDAYVINRLDPKDDAWVDTGVVVDDRNDSRADMLWTGSKLYTVSGGTSVGLEADAPILLRMSYDAQSGTYSMDEGFPVRIARGGAETFTLDRDETGRLWVTWTTDRKVWVSRSLDDDRHWSVPAPLPVPEAGELSPDDISSVVAYDGHVGIMWSAQPDGAMYWASTPVVPGTAEPVWSVTAAVQGPGLADDHVNLQALHDDPAGLVFAAVKTSRNDAPSAKPFDPLIMLMVLERDGTWARHVVSTVKENETRPLLAVDAEHRRLYVITSAPCCSGGTIYSRATSLDRIEFPTGRGSVLMRSTSDALNNPSSAKHDVTGETDLVVIASDDKADLYMHASIDLGGPPVPKPTPSAVADPPGGSPVPSSAATSSLLLQDGFEDGAMDEWLVQFGGPGSTVNVQPPAARTDRMGLRVTSSSSPDAFAYARVTLPEVTTDLAVDLDFRVLAEGPDDANAPLLRLLAPDGTRLLSLYRQNQTAGRIWTATPGGREPTLGRTALDTWAHLEVTTQSRGTDVVADVHLDGQFVGQVVLGAVASGIGSVQVGNETHGQMFDINIDNVRVRR